VLHRILKWRLPLRAPGWLLALVCLAAAAGGTFFLDRTYLDPHRGFPSEAPAWARQLGNRWLTSSLPEGSPAPDFRLPSFRDGRQRGLADFRGRRPVVLVFGSFSCHLLCNDIAGLERLYHSYRGRVGFLFISVKEAGHRIPGLEFVLDAGDSAGQRRAAVQRGAAVLGLTMPGVMDGPDRRVMNAYKAFPRRLVVVDRQGRVALDLGSGLMWKWDLAQVDEWLKANTPNGAVS
jgi:peroxiredoxin